MNIFNFIMYSMLILIIVIYIFIFYNYIKDELYIFKNTIPVKTSQCLLNSCDKNYYFDKSEDQ